MYRQYLYTVENHFETLKLERLGFFAKPTTSAKLAKCNLKSQFLKLPWHSDIPVEQKLVTVGLPTSRAELDPMARAGWCQHPSEGQG